MNKSNLFKKKILSQKKSEDFFSDAVLQKNNFKTKMKKGKYGYNLAGFNNVQNKTSISRNTKQNHNNNFKQKFQKNYKQMPSSSLINSAINLSNNVK